MASCLCESIRQLADQYNDKRAQSLLADLDEHLRDLRAVLAQSKSLSRDLRYRVTLSNARTSKALDVGSIDLDVANEVVAEYGRDLVSFWADEDRRVHPDLRRRLATVVVFLGSKLDAGAPAPPMVLKHSTGQHSLGDLRNAGRKYVKIARKLGGLGALLWLPLSVPPSTYERYLNIDDEVVFDHLKSLAPSSALYADFVQRVIVSQLQETSSYAYWNLLVDYSDFVPTTDQFALLLYSLGGSDVPEPLLTNVRAPQRRWNADGEIESTNAFDYGLSPELVRLLSDDRTLENAAEEARLVTRRVQEDGIFAWSLTPGMISYLSQTLDSSTREKVGEMALKLICFACPPCFEGSMTWTPAMKATIWSTVQNTLKSHKIPANFRIPLIDSILYFCERDSVEMRRLAVEEARSLLRKSMPYYLHASVALFRSVLHRLEGDFVKSEASIRDFIFRGPQPETRRDKALQGRLHISQIDNKIKCYDSDVSTFIYKWAAEKPLSTLEIEVTSRLQSAAARYFQSVGDFGVARASLEQFMALNTTRPLRANSRYLLVGRMVDVYCEMDDHAKALGILQNELGGFTETERRRRLYRKLLLSTIEAYIGLGDLSGADSLLAEVGDTTPVQESDLYDEQVHMRTVIAAARVSHMKLDNQEEAVRRWRFALGEVERMHTLKAGHGFTAAMVYLSLAHGQLASGDENGARQAWATGTQILRTEPCEFWIPIVPTTWLDKIASDVLATHGWTCRMILPGGKPDKTWPA